MICYLYQLLPAGSPHHYKLSIAHLFVYLFLEVEIRQTSSMRKQYTEEPDQALQ